MTCTLPIYHGSGFLAKVWTYAIIDGDDYERLSAHRWTCSPRANAYPRRTGVGPNGRPQSVLLHHDVIGRPPAGLVTDHIDRNVFNARKSNLRHVTHAENMRNRAPFKWYRRENAA